MSGSVVGQANPNANLLCKQIFDYLSTLGDDCAILYSQDLGHVDNISASYASYVTDLQTNTGVLLPMIGGDYGLGNYNMTAINNTLENHWNQKKLITLSWHLPNPWTGGDSWDITNQGLLADLINPAKMVSTVWTNQLDEIANVLLDLKSRGVVVLWRPLHEANGSWFWWGHAFGSSSSTAYKALWQHMFNYFTNDKGLDNLLWVYSAGEGWDNATDFCYPGNTFVDVVGIDLYHDDLSVVPTQDFTNLIGLGKIFAITEFGPDIPNDPANYNYSVVHNFIKNQYPEVAYMHAWHSWAGHFNTYIENINASDILNDACHRSPDPSIFSISTNAYNVGADFIEIIPNPVPNQLRINGVPSVADINIYNSLGQLVMTLNGMSSPIVFDVTSLGTK
ncbi:MAG: hypothetical protein IPL46_14675 [Saprospiraceae bacterium]|nr:hypothetical protein [Saprospiraceae bacterium]